MIIVTNDGNIPSRFAHSFQVMKMAQGFYDAGIEVVLITFLSLPLIKNIFLFGDVYNFYGIRRNIKVKRVITLDKHFLFNTIGGEKYNIRAAKIIASAKPTFVYCRSYLTAYYCVQQGVPAIMEAHTTHYDIPQLRKIYQIAKEKKFLGIVTIHSKIRQEFIERGVSPEKILVAEDGVDLAFFDIEDDKMRWRAKLGLPANKKIIMYCGSLFVEKGIEDILKTAKKLEKKKDIVFVFVGGSQRQIKRWQKYCFLNNINNVIFAGFVKAPLVPQYLKAADILIMLYNTNIEYIQMDINTTSPLKLFEYMAAKRPIISSSIPAIAKILTNNKNSLLAQPNNIDEVVVLILELLSDPQKAEQLAYNAYKTVQKYSWEKRSQAIIDKFIGYERIKKI